MKIRVNPELSGSVIAWLIRILGWTLRFEQEDRSPLRDRNYRPPLICTFWHNRMFVMPLLHERFFPHRPGTALTSPSGDGAIIAAVMKNFGMESVRGSSSRRGSAALRELAAALEQGRDLGVTPDGPRGPRYKLGPGVVFLAGQTGAAIQPIRVEYSRALRLKSWDRFMIPMPFSRVRVIYDSLITVAPDADPETERLRIEKLLQPETE